MVKTIGSISKGDILYEIYPTPRCGASKGEAKRSIKNKRSKKTKKNIKKALFDPKSLGKDKKRTRLLRYRFRSEVKDLPHIPLLGGQGAGRGAQ